HWLKFLIGIHYFVLLIERFLSRPFFAIGFYAIGVEFLIFVVFGGVLYASCNDFFKISFCQ
uniref:hypothetical protein n=1 Tax=Vibrio cholerae TaxID=666 RepID=UPI001F15A35A